MAESRYQARLIKKLKKIFEGCVILKNDESYMQGVPDLVIFFGGRWAMLEVKDSADSPFQPNQEYYIAKFNKMWYASVIYPENEREVIDALQFALSPAEPSARIS
jgi:hypothetical protein